MNAQAIADDLRSAFITSGLIYTDADARAALHDRAPSIAAHTAEILMLSLAGHEDPGQDTFNNIMDGTLGLLSDMLRACFSEFGGVDEDEVSAILATAQAALLERLQALADATTAGGCA